MPRLALVLASLLAPGLVAADAAAEPPPAPAAPPAATTDAAAAAQDAALPPSLHLQGLDHFAEFAERDPEFTQASTLAFRAHAAKYTWVFGVSVGALLAVVGGMMRDGNDTLANGPFVASSRDGRVLATTGISLALGSIVAAWALHPGRGEVERVVAAWNAGHPDEAVEVR